jgi:hypothetical protein
MGFMPVIRSGERFEHGVVGGAISGTFALTVHAL